MKDPTRWLDDPQTPASLREVLGAGIDMPSMSQPSHTHLAAFATGLVSRTATGLAATTAAKAGATAFSVAGASKVVVVLSLFGAVGAGSYLAAQRFAPPVLVANRVPSGNGIQPRPVASASVQHGAPAVMPAAIQPPLSSSSASSNLRQRAAAISAPGSNRLNRGSRSHNAAAFDDLGIGDEARLLEGARAALPSNPTRALDIAEEHQRLYPNGQLSAERELIAVDALLRLGQRQKAEQRAAPQLRDSSNSVYAKRLRQLFTTAIQ